MVFSFGTFSAKLV